MIRVIHAMVSVKTSNFTMIHVNYFFEVIYQDQSIISVHLLHQPMLTQLYLTILHTVLKTYTHLLVHSK